MPSSDPDSWFDGVLGAMELHEEERSEIVGPTQDDIELGLIAVERNLISPQQFRSCLATLKNADPRPSLMQILLQENLVEPKALTRLIVEKGANERPDFPRYRFLECIGRGGSAEVWRAQDEELDRPVAVKILKPGVQVQRFVREARAAGGLSHPNVVTVHDVGEQDGRKFMVMELVEGKSLALALRDGIESLNDKVRILQQASRGVAAAHDSGIVHRDLKPGNILINQDGVPKVGDFGLAQEIGGETRLTRTGVPIGTPMYMAPEQVRGESDGIGRRTDVYALGAILYQMMEGRPPHADTDVGSIYQKVLHEEPPPPKGPRDLVRICRKALQKDYELRYRHAGEFADDLTRYLDGRPIEAKGGASLRNVGRAIRMQRTPIVAIVAVILVLCAGFLLYLRYQHEHARERGAQAWRENRWNEALVHLERSLDFGWDPEVAAMAESCRRRIAGERRKLREAEQYRRVTESLLPVQRIVQETQDAFYIRGVDIREKLRFLEEQLAGLEVLTRDPEASTHPEVWLTLGMGWYLVGDTARAENALLLAESQESRDGRVYYYLGRIYLERSFGNPLHFTTWSREERKEMAKDLSAKALDYMKRETGDWGGAEQIDRMIAQASRALAEGKKTDVFRICQEGLKKFKTRPKTEEFWLLLAAAESKSAKVIEYYSNAIRVQHHCAFAYFMRGYRRMRVRDHANALKDAEHAILIRPKHALAHVLRGLVLQLKKDPAPALASFAEAIRLSPSDPAPYYFRAILRKNIGDFKGAAEDYSTIIRVQPSPYQGYFMRGQIRMNEGQFHEAIDDFSSAIRIHPTYYSAVEARGRARIEVGEYDAAEKDLTRALELTPTSTTARFHRGRARLRLRDFEGCVADYDRILDGKRPYPEARANRALGRAGRGDYKGAVEDFERALEEAPEDWKYRKRFQEKLELARKKLKGP